MNLVHEALMKVADEAMQRLGLPPVKPVRILPCPRCHGLGWVDDIHTNSAKLCPTCDGRMRIATNDGEV